jgi:hypothetical protein
MQSFQNPGLLRGRLSIVSHPDSVLGFRSRTASRVRLHFYFHIQHGERIMTPEAALQIGREILDPILKLHGYKFLETIAGKGSGGYFSSAEYWNGDRRLELHFRQSLGLVRYHFGSMSLSHDDYMAAKLGGRGLSAYPGFSSDPIDGFRHLREDLELHCGEFLAGDQVAFRKLVDVLRKLPRLPK